MGTQKLSFGKIASTPTKTAWSQAYNAGDLFIVLTLTQKELVEKEATLATLGKQFLDEVQAEFFSLESKNLEGISEVLTQAANHIPEEIELTTLTSFVKNQTLYLFLIGKGTILLKRGERTGTLLTNEEASRTLHSASGHLKPHDTVVMASQAFQKAIAKDDMLEAISASEIDETVESLTPHIHKLEEGSASAIFFRAPDNGEIEDTPSLIESATDEENEEKNEEDIVTSSDEVSSEPKTAYDPPANEPTTESSQAVQEEDVSPKKQTKLAFPSFLTGLLANKNVSNLSHRRKVFLSIAVVLVLVLFASVFFTIQNQHAKERQELFDEVYPQAMTNYEEAEGLLSLNKALAREQLEEAEALLEKTDGKFPKGTDEYEKTEALKKDIASLLSEVGDSRTVPTEEISEEESLLLASLIPNDRVASVEDDTSVYFLTNDEIVSIRKASKSEQTLVENDDDWSDAQGLGKFGSNFYVLDQNEGILKFVPSGSDYTVSDYLTEDVDLTDAVSMAIDSSIYVLSSNGDIKKFTRGAEDSFSVSGLETKFAKPVQIVTSEDMNSLYILDPQTARIVKLSKAGRFEEEYQTSILQNAKAIAISSDEKTATILSSGKLYEMSL